MKKLLQRTQSVHTEEKFKADSRLQALSPHKSERITRWAVKFAAFDLHSLSHGQLSDLQYEIDHFARFSGRPKFPTGPVAFPSAYGSLPWPMSPQIDISTSTSKDEASREHPDLAMMFEIQRRTRLHFEKLLSGKRTELNLPERTKEELYYFINGDRVEVDFSLCADPLTSYEHALLSSLAQNPGRLRRCPGCQTVFFSERNNQDYHSAACRSRHYMRIKRRIPPERFGKRGRPKGTTLAAEKEPLRSLRRKKQIRLPTHRSTHKRKVKRHGKKRR